VNDFDETAEDIAFVPQPGCCEHCDDELDFAEWEAQVSS
jgi:hypothetical protein